MDVMINGTRFIAERPPTAGKLRFHELIKAAREQNMETLENAANAIGTTKSRMWELEQGDTMPRLPMLQKILKHYGLRFDEIADV
jgi:transcriptional regulator with XRE-family HTH domain